MGDAAATEEVAELLGSGEIRAVIGARYALEDIAEAHRALERKDVVGDVMIEVVPAEVELAVVGG